MSCGIWNDRSRSPPLLFFSLADLVHAGSSSKRRKALSFSSHAPCGGSPPSLRTPTVHSSLSIHAFQLSFLLSWPPSPLPTKIALRSFPRSKDPQGALSFVGHSLFPTVHTCFSLRANVFVFVNFFVKRACFFTYPISL